MVCCHGFPIKEKQHLRSIIIDEGFYQGEREDLRGGGLIRSAGGVFALLSRGSDANESADERILGRGEFVDFVLNAKRAERPSSAIDEILGEVSATSGIPAKTILGQSRVRTVCKARVDFFPTRAGRSRSYGNGSRPSDRAVSCCSAASPCSGWRCEG